MTFKRISLGCAFVASTILLLAACTNLKEPARQAIESAQAAIAAASIEATEYVPDQLAEVQSKLDALKASFGKQDYKTVISDAPDVLAAAQELASAATAKKSEIRKALNDDWTQLSAGVPQLIEAVQKRIDSLTKKKKLSPGVDLNAAKSNLSEASGLWSKAQGAFSSDNLHEAVKTAKDVKDRAQAAASSLQMDLSNPVSPQ